MTALNDSPAESRPLVSIVIPTFRRPLEVQQAVRSALLQTWEAVEVLVVSDGPDPATREALLSSDPRLRYLELPANQGPAAARNAGVAASRGEWLAFLDDDDQMCPGKIAAQMMLADRRHPDRMIACQVVYRYNRRQDVWPKRPISPSEDLSEYLLLRRHPLDRPGVLPLQSLLLHRSVTSAIPFSSHEDHEDWAWLLEAWYRRGVRVIFAWEPLVIYNIDTAAESRSRRLNWRASLAWAQMHRHWITDRAYSSFLATKVAMKAKRAGDWQGLRVLGKEIACSRPSSSTLLLFAAVLVLPRGFLHRAWKRSLSNRSKTSRPVTGARAEA